MGPKPGPGKLPLARRLVMTLAGALALTNPASAQSLPRVRIETSLGNIDVEVDSVRAPVTATNFLRYVDAHFYDHGLFHRTVTPGNQPTNPVKIEVIQAGGDTTRAAQAFPAIPLERTSTTGLHHQAGAISMARGGADTAQDQFFICVTAQPGLDFGGRRNPDGQGFAVFGRVVSGQKVVRAIQRSPADGQKLTPPITILRVARR